MQQPKQREPSSLSFFLFLALVLVPYALFLPLSPPNGKHRLSAVPTGCRLAPVAGRREAGKNERSNATNRQARGRGSALHTLAYTCLRLHACIAYGSSGGGASGKSGGRRYLWWIDRQVSISSSCSEDHQRFRHPPTGCCSTRAAPLRAVRICPGDRPGGFAARPRVLRLSCWPEDPGCWHVRPSVRIFVRSLVRSPEPRAASLQHRNTTQGPTGGRGGYF